jgi:hypothetical protein
MGAPQQIHARDRLSGPFLDLFRRMAVIMHRMWADGTEFRWTSTNIAAA